MATATKKKTTKKTTAKKEEQELEIPALELRVVELQLIGVTSLIPDAWRPWAIEKLEAKQQGKAEHKKAPKDPEKEYMGGFYKWPGGDIQDENDCYAFPGTAFKRAVQDAGERYMDGVRKVTIGGALFVLDAMVPIKVTGEVKMRTDMGRSGMSRDTRYRPDISGWETRVMVEYNSRALSLEQVVALFDLAGFGVGVGNWRPEKKGSHGKWRVGQVREIGRE